MKEHYYSFYEEYPLQNTGHYQKSRSKQPLRGPLRVARLCILGVLLPSMFISIPLYLRLRVYGLQLYPLATSDMRMLDNKISTTWCQGQRVQANTTFNAFLLPDTPKLAQEKKTLSMVRELVLEDDTKEYWGFYLLKGTSVTVSTCVRWPGASLIVLRGHKHLHECAYIGDDSSEELDEMMEAIREGTYVEEANKTMTDITDEDQAPANEPLMMKRHRPDVEFHSPVHHNSSKNQTLDHDVDNSEITDAKHMRKILDALQEKVKSSKKKVANETHHHREKTIAVGEDNNLKIEKPKNQTSSQEMVDEILMKLRDMGAKGEAILGKINQEFVDQKLRDVMGTKGRHYSKPAVEFGEDIDRSRRKRREILLSKLGDFNEDDQENDKGMEEGLHPDGIADHRGRINETTLNDMSNSEFWSSFSSSEEALLNCAGLILNLPLTPHTSCHPSMNQEESYRDNTITYRVPMNGYYFFVFNSENEVQQNFIRVHFNIEKAIYDVSNPVAACINTSETCSLNLNFFSSQKLVLELPVPENNTLWNEEFVIVSECEPRTAIYMMCAVLVLIMVVMFAFT
nr:unnamed protein product [Callosobruchus chinensis]